MSAESKFRVSAAQTSILCTFFEENPQLLRGYRKTYRNRKIVRKKWKRVTEKLNSCGPMRSQKSWATYLSNVKAKLKGQSIIWKQSSDGTGPVMCNANKFNEIQLRILQVLCRNTHETNSDEPQNSPAQSETIDSSDDDTDTDNGMVIVEDNSQDIEPGENVPGHVKFEENSHSSNNNGNPGINTTPDRCMSIRMSRELKYRVTAAQTKILALFFEQNPEVVRGYKKTTKYKKQVQNKWKKITPKLNAYGPSRDYRSWSKYLCNMKAKLKGQKIKWRQSSNGTGPIICNADDFNEIQLRMLQVLRRDASNSQQAEDSPSDSETEEVNDDDIDTDNDIVMLNKNGPDIKPGMYIEHMKLEENENTPQTSKIFVDDEFASFGRNVAEQLRTLPLPVALETQEKLLSVLRDQRIQLLIGSTRCLDPLEKS